MNEENEEFEREMNYKPPSQIAMEEQAREFTDGQEEEEETKYITVLDFEDGRVFQYKLWYVPSDANGNTYKRFLNDNGHNLTNCQWMVHGNSEIITI